MLPSQLSGVYRQYKEDTDSVAAWLASTAKSCGYPADLLASPSWDAPQAKKSTRLKGKQRKQAKASGKANTAPKTSKYIVAIKDFLPLADFIAGRTNPSVTVPTVFSQTLNRVITLRTGYGQMRTESGAEPDAEGDEKHGYFVGVLQAVRDALRPRMTTEEAAASADKPSPSSNASTFQATAEDLGNKFAALNVDDPSQAFIDDFTSAPVERPKAQEQDPVDYTAEEPVSLEELLFSMTLLFNDLMKIRSRIDWIWSNHRDGFFDLGAAAVATNIAIALARGMIEEVEPILNRYEGGAYGVLNKLFLIIGHRKGYTLEQMVLDGPDNFPYDLYELTDEAYLVAYRLLLSCADVLQPNQLPLIKEGMFGHYDAKSDRTKKSGREKFLEDQILIMELFTEFITLIRCVASYPVEDEVIRGMRVLEKTKTVSFSLVFAVQMVLDINHIMRDGARSSFNIMVQQTSAIETHLKSYLEYHKNLRIDNWPASNDMALKDFIRRIQWVGSDPIHKVKSKVMKSMGVPVSPQMELHRMFIYSPVIAGMYLYRTRYEMWDCGIAIANAWGSIAYTGHLYNALRQQNLIQGTWPDMDLTLSLLGESNVWVGDERPVSIGDCFQKFCLQMGVTASAFTTKRRKNIGSLHSRAGPRGFKDGCPVSAKFTAEWISGNDSDFSWTPEMIKDILARSRFIVEESGENGVTITALDTPVKGKGKGKSQQKGKVDMPTADALAKALILALHFESMEMAFPYTLMHRWCWNLLRQVKNECDPLLRQLYTPSYLERENQLPWIIGYILMAASGIDGGVQDERLLKAAAGVFSVMTETEAGMVSMVVMKKLGFDIGFEAEAEESDAEEE
ncbi:unnamed protein product [Clonostachys rosea]|uniref:DUF6604 domain-containing protein n=1 Tax=Bionectria ochroleuca TaxID=29856 RepID=A0ABY6TUK6_BIOOC|nr:unnamed protein product [Clonostachys rosea]